jgi:EF-hand domain-containing family member B
LHGSYTPQEQAPDADLGKSLREGFRNLPPNSVHTFGVPSVRTDLHPPSRASIANAQNYGNEPNAYSLLVPCATADRGVNEEHYAAKKSREEVEELVRRAGIEMDQKSFSACFEEAAAVEGGLSKASLMAFMSTRHQLLQRSLGL